MTMARTSISDVWSNSCATAARCHMAKAMVVIHFHTSHLTRAIDPRGGKECDLTCWSGGKRSAPLSSSAEGVAG